MNYRNGTDATSVDITSWAGDGTWSYTYSVWGHSRAEFRPETWRDKLLISKPWTYYTLKLLDRVRRNPETQRPIQSKDPNYLWKMLRVRDKFKFQSRNT